MITIATIIIIIIYHLSGAYLQIMEWGAMFKLGPFLYRKYKRGIKESNVSTSC